MNKLISSLLFGFALLAFSFTAKSATETITFKVNGTSACESQIENIVSNLEGVTSADWNPSTQIITVVFDTDTIKKEYFYFELAKGGYDNQGLRAKEVYYNALPDACKYTREPEVD